MSSYGNHVWTQERQAAADNLVELAVNCDDDGFAEQLHTIAGISPTGWPFAPDAPEMTIECPTCAVQELLAVTALLAERLGGMEAQARGLVVEVHPVHISELWKGQ